MATKTTSKKKTTSTKKTTAKKTTRSRKSTAAEGEAPTETVPETQAETTPRARRGGARSGGGRRSTRTKETPATTAPEALSVKSPETPEVEESDDGIVIRFAPVAPPPFVAPPAALLKAPELPVPEITRSAEARSVTPPPAREPEPLDLEDDLSEIEGAATEELAPPEWIDEEEPQVEMAAEPDVEAEESDDAAEPLTPEELSHLSESQKRRRRRRRRGGGRRDGEGRAPREENREQRDERDDRNRERPENREAAGAGRRDDRGERRDDRDDRNRGRRDDRRDGRGDRNRNRRSEPDEQRGPREPVEVEAESVPDASDEVLDEIIDIDEEGGAVELADGPTEVDERTDRRPPREGDRDEGGRGRRRRRRGRRGGGGGGRESYEEDDVVDIAEPAAPSSSGRRVRREMVINAIPREECRIAILADNRLEEIYFERATAENHVGNIYKGVVTNVEASIQAAFIDFGQGKNGFLHISDLHPKYFPDGMSQTENVGHKMPRRNRPPIQRCLRRGQEVIVQVTKEGIGTKGPTLTTYLSIPGRFLVMMPGMGRLGVSRRIEEGEARDKLRQILAQLEFPEGMGFIGRTAALERTKEELENDLRYLTRLWRAVEKRHQSDNAPAELYRESDLVIRTIRDVFTDDIEKIVVDDPEVAERARDFLSIFSPKAADIITAFTDPTPIFHKYGIEAELDRLHSRRVPLKSGGSLVIEPTEALVAIDVNSGSFRTEDDAENTAFKINMEAADEIARQLRLRDLGGVVICDFIDMRLEKHRREIERRLARHLRDHKERAKVLRMSEFGIIELTRQRQRASLTRSVYQDCSHCRGTGLVKTVESVALDVIRLIQLAATRDNIYTIEVTVAPEVSFLLQNRKRRLIHDLELKNRRIISIRPDPGFGQDQVDIQCADARGRLVPHM